MHPDLPLVIRTDRLLLRPLDERDVEALTRIYSDPEIHRFLGGSATVGRPAAWRQIAISLGHRQMRGYTMLGIVDRASGDLIGRSGPWFPEGWPQLEVGWVVETARQGEGIASEAGRASLRWCFDVLEAKSVCSLIREANEPSRAVARKLGAGLDRVLDEFYGEPAEVWLHRPATLTQGPGDEARFDDE